MPHPGLKVARSPDFDGKLSGMFQPVRMLAFKTQLLGCLLICIEDHSHFTALFKDNA
jgi:hypothetical protein